MAHKKLEECFKHIVEKGEYDDEFSTLFHEFAVNKCKSIYESMLDEYEDDDEFSDELPVKDFIDDIESEEGGMREAEEDEFDIDDNEFDFDDEEGEEEYDFDDEEEGEEDTYEEDLEGRVIDVEDALADLEAEFAKIVDGGEYGDDESEEELGMEFDDESDEESDEEEMDFDDESEEDKKNESFVREYDEKVTIPTGSREVGNGKTVSVTNTDVIPNSCPSGSMRTKGNVLNNPTPKSRKYGDKMETDSAFDRGQKSAPKPKSEDPGKGKGPVAKSSKKKMN